MNRPHYKFWPKRLPHSITPPATSLWDNLAVSARRYPGKPAVVFFGRIYSYAEVLHLAERLAARLHSLGVRKGARVMLDMQNCPQLLIAHFAILRANAVVVPVNPMNRAEEQRLAHLIVTQFTDGFDPDTSAAGPMPESWRGWLLTRHELPRVPGGKVMAWSEALAGELPLPPLEAGPEDLALLPYTSGTTGKPKGCMHPHRTFMHNAVASSFWGNATAERVALLVTPMFHATGMITMHTNIYTGCTMLMMPRWDRDLAGRLISRWKVTNWMNIPTMVIDLLASPDFAQYDLSSLVTIGGGGAAMPQAVAQRLLEQFQLRYLEAYGLTETAAPSHGNPPDAPKQQCLGIPFLSCDARVVDPETLTEVPPGEHGEIIVHGPMVFNGYWKNPDATAAAFVEFEGKRFFRTGDIGRTDEDGYFFMTDRLKRMINTSGFKVWPAEVETLMFRHPAIQEACVIPAHDSYRGETVKAVVVLRDSFQGQVSEQDIIDWCRENMAVYKAPRIVQFAEALPRSASGKVMWRQLQEADAARVLQ